MQTYIQYIWLPPKSLGTQERYQESYLLFISSMRNQMVSARRTLLLNVEQRLLQKCLYFCRISKNENMFRTWWIPPDS